MARNKTLHMTLLCRNKPDGAHFIIVITIPSKPVSEASEQVLICCLRIFKFAFSIKLGIVAVAIRMPLLSTLKKGSSYHACIKAHSRGQAQNVHAMLLLGLVYSATSILSVLLL